MGIRWKGSQELGAGRRAWEGIPGKVGGGVLGAGGREEGWGRYTREGRGRGPGSWWPGGGLGKVYQGR